MGAPLVIGILVFLFTVFPTTNFGGNSIRMFAPERLSFDGLGFAGRVLGNHVLETEFGEIVLHRFARIYSTRYRNVGIIEKANFTRGRASHNLVVEGIAIPQHIRIILNPGTQQLSVLDLSFPTRLLQDFQELSVSGIPLRVGRIYLDSPRNPTADIRLGPIWPDYIELADTTVIGFPPIAVPDLHIYKEDALWRIDDRTSVKLPGQTEFVEYREITFRPHWGEFIGGVRVE
jgi:hypothetical protein